MNALIFLLAGTASWFQPLPMYGDMAVCAANVVPIKTDVVIVNEANGRRARCRIIGTGPFVAGRVIDTSPSVARELGFYDAGLTRVRVYLAR